MTGDISVLLVDDDEEWVTLTGKLLERVDHELTVTTETDVEAASATLDRTSPDCIVSDYKMPDVGGLTFLEAVRETHPDVPFILITGSGSEEVASEAISLGVTDYFIKQYGTDQSTVLATRIRNAVEAHRVEQALASEREMKESLRDILARSSSRAEIETAFCEQVVDGDRYAFAWIGDTSASQSLAPRAWADEEGAGNDGSTYLDRIDLDGDGSTTAEPSVAALRTREVQVVRDVVDSRYDSWETAAAEQGYRAVAAIPLVHRDVPYGVFSAYAPRAAAFDDRERRTLVDLASSLAYALHAAERGAALAADLVDSVELRVTDANYYPIALAEGLAGEIGGGRVHVDGLVPHEAEYALAFLTVDALEAAARPLAADHPDVRAVRSVRDYDDGCRLELVVARPTLATFLADNGGDVREIVATPGKASVVVDFHRRMDVHDVVGRLRSLYPDVVIRSKRTVERPPRSRNALRELATEDLTDKQDRAVRTAYLAGYFESPRERSADEVADSLGVSRSTFLEHLRLAERRVLGGLIDE